MNLLIQFLLRLSFGLAAGMAITSSRRVTSGYFRNNLYVILGLTTLAAAVSYYAAPHVLWYATGAALASYVGAVCWLYEKQKAGKCLLLFIALTCWVGMTRHAASYEDRRGEQLRYLQRYGEGEEVPNGLDNKLDRASVVLGGNLVLASMFTSSFLLGMTMAAMLLGHWYLNSPTMELVPLQRLIIAMGAAVVLQAIVSALGLWGELTYANEVNTQWWLFLLLRWSFGIVGVAVLAWMAWETLKIPNTQSATGILYVAVIGTFVGETMAMLLSAESLFPL